MGLVLEPFGRPGPLLGLVGSAGTWGSLSVPTASSSRSIMVGGGFGTQLSEQPLCFQSKSQLIHRWVDVGVTNKATGDGKIGGMVDELVGLTSKLVTGANIAGLGCWVLSTTSPST